MRQRDSTEEYLRLLSILPYCFKASPSKKIIHKSDLNSTLFPLNWRKTNWTTSIAPFQSLVKRIDNENDWQVTEFYAALKPFGCNDGVDRQTTCPFPLVSNPIIIHLKSPHSLSPNLWGACLSSLFTVGSLLKIAFKNRSYARFFDLRGLMFVVEGSLARLRAQ